MSAASLGMPVEIGRIDKELGKLWESTDDSKTRASLINLAIYTEDESAASQNTDLISKIATEHACRALLILANPESSESRAQAWINAHCHVAGKRQICSEQITFQLEGEAASALPNVVFSHLDSDLPLCFWWQGEFHEPLDEKIWAWVDRLIYDSAEWKNPAAQFEIADRIAALTETRTVLCDLNWTRLLGVRFALAQFFDHSFALQHLRHIERVTITAAKKSTGLLLLGWLAAQLDWKLQSLLGKKFFLSPEGQHVEFAIEESGDATVSSCVFERADARLEITRDADSEYFHARMSCDEKPCKTMLLSAGKSDPEDVLLEELSRGGRHPLYAKAREAIAELI